MVNTKDARVGNKPTAAFVLTLLGGIFVLLGGIAVTMLGAAVTLFFAHAAIGGLLGLLGIIAGIIIIVAAVLLNSTDESRVKEWSVVALVLTIISIVNGGGFIIGFILGLVGSILGLTYKG